MKKFNSLTIILLLLLMTPIQVYGQYYGYSTTNGTEYSIEIIKIDENKDNHIVDMKYIVMKGFEVTTIENLVISVRLYQSETDLVQKNRTIEMLLGTNGTEHFEISIKGLSGSYSMQIVMEFNECIEFNCKSISTGWKNLALIELVSQENIYRTRPLFLDFISLFYLLNVLTVIAFISSKTK